MKQTVQFIYHRIFKLNPLLFTSLIILSLVAVNVYTFHEMKNKPVQIIALVVAFICAAFINTFFEVYSEEKKKSAAIESPVNEIV